VSLTAADVAEILRLLEQSSFDELNLEMNGMKLSLRRGGGAAGAAEEALNRRAAGSASAALAGSGARAGSTSPNRTDAASAAHSNAAQGAAPNQAATHAVPARTTDPDIHDVPSPLLGTFYRSPKPGAPPFVEVGAQVSEESIVAIIEVMKLMNTVRAGVKGTVTEILPGDGTLVEYDQPILRIRKAG
jgi:acetyl-CoA carboxylase biotin carboxyl carrier protein